MTLYYCQHPQFKSPKYAPAGFPPVANEFTQPNHDFDNPTTDPVAQNALDDYSILHFDHTHTINYESVQRTQRGRIA